MADPGFSIRRGALTPDFEAETYRLARVLPKTTWIGKKLDRGSHPSTPSSHGSRNADTSSNIRSNQSHDLFGIRLRHQGYRRVHTDLLPSPPQQYEDFCGFIITTLAIPLKSYSFLGNYCSHSMELSGQF